MTVRAFPGLAAWATFLNLVLVKLSKDTNVALIALRKNVVSLDIVRMRESFSSMREILIV